MNLRKIWAMAKKEARQASRDPLSLAMLLGLPTIMLLMYGYAINFDVRHVRLAVRDLDKSEESRSLVASFVNSTYFDQVADVPAGADVDLITETRVAKAVLAIPEGFARTLAQESPQLRLGRKLEQHDHDRRRDRNKRQHRSGRDADNRREQADTLGHRGRDDAQCQKCLPRTFIGGLARDTLGRRAVHQRTHVADAHGEKHNHLTRGKAGQNDQHDVQPRLFDRQRARV